VPVRREYLLAGNEYYYRDRHGQIGQKLKPAVFLEFENKGGQLGKPLPAGIVRVYAKDSKGAAQFVGEDRIEHTAKNEKLKLRLGEAFDITAERRQTNYKRIADNQTESSWRIELRNAKDEAVTVRVQEPMPGDWEMVQESQKHSKESARVAVVERGVPAGRRCCTREAGEGSVASFSTIHFCEVRPSRPTGPRAWNLSVEMPISAPRPNSKPSAKRVEAFTITEAESTSRRKRIAFV
jgi:hypothetical protein